MIYSNSILEITGAKLLSLKSDILIRHLLLDSRKIISPADSLFFAIKGVRHNGHLYISSLYKRGIRNFIIESNSELPIEDYPEGNFWEVENSITALQKIAAFHRSQYSLPVIGITGSNGKTIVKEWLSQLLNKDFHIVKNPRSYNSQIGVPLSVWELNNRHTLGIFEAGISQPKEMKNLRSIIQPSIGIFTNIGQAHDEGFASTTEKINEKLQLFSTVDLLFYRKNNAHLENGIATLSCKTFCWSTDHKEVDLFVSAITKSNAHSSIHLVYKEKEYAFVIPFLDDASIENILHCIAVLFHFQISTAEIQNRLFALTPIGMRMELKEGINNSYIIDDTYNNDIAGLTMALNFLDQQKQRPSKTIILSDLLESGEKHSQLYAQIANMLLEKKVSKIIGIGKHISENKICFEKFNNASFYDSTEDFIRQFDKKQFSNELILVKGARIFAFENIIKLLQQKIHGTSLEINLDALAHNLNFYRSRLQPGTKVMAMVKAFAYGSGSYEVANLLQFHRVDYLAVAYADEGIALRENGISLPIMVMNPSASTFDKIIQYQLEPEIYSFKILNEFIHFLQEHQLSSSIHLKLDTGMHRLGFEQESNSELLHLLQSPLLKVISIFTHLAAADEEVHNDFTNAQLSKFEKMANRIEDVIGYKTIRHALNSAGIIRFPNAHLDMVRLGIGLYGVEANGIQQSELQFVSTLKTIISQIKNIKAGESIGYSRKGKAEKDTTIATIAIGYADGFNRKFGNGKGYVLINGKQCPTIGNICMDMCMIDITNVPASEGDEVVIFGTNPTIIELAKKIDTIPYELLTSIGERVKRVFFAE